MQRGIVKQSEGDVFFFFKRLDLIWGEKEPCVKDTTKRFRKCKNVTQRAAENKSVTVLNKKEVTAEILMSKTSNTRDMGNFDAMRPLVELDMS